jgi:hypothetical protein
MADHAARRHPFDATVCTSGSSAIPALFNEPDRVISLATVGRLLNHCVAATGASTSGSWSGSAAACSPLAPWVWW